MTQGLRGSLTINNSRIIAAPFGYAFGGTEAFAGTITNSSASGSMRISNSTVETSELIFGGNTTNNYVDHSNIISSTLNGTGFTCIDSSFFNDSITTMPIHLRSVSLIQTAMDNCELTIIFGMIYKSELNGCTFTSFSCGTIRDSNLINCGKLSTDTQKMNYEEDNLTGNYWGERNTAELNTYGVNYNLSFIGDYYDDFSYTKLNLSGFKTEAIADAGIIEVTDSVAIYSIGDDGPGGGIIFYDKGFYSDGWRYLEAAPSDLGNGNTYIFGLYKTSDDGYTQWSGTGYGIGLGKLNTRTLVADMRTEAYESRNGITKTENYAAQLCDTYSYGGYSDWFLPSRDELKLMYTNLKEEGLGDFENTNYWSSSESEYDACAWHQDFSVGTLYSSSNGGNRNSSLRVRPIRAF